MQAVVAGSGQRLVFRVEDPPAVRRLGRNHVLEVRRAGRQDEFEPWGEGVRGCVQFFTTGPALARNYERLRQQVKHPIPADAQPTTGELVARLAEQDDELATQVMTQAGEVLGITIATLAMVLDVELFVIGGSVAKSGDLLFEPARQIVPDYAYDSIASHVRIVGAELGDDGPILGCGWLARQTLSEE